MDRSDRYQSRLVSASRLAVVSSLVVYLALIGGRPELSILVTADGSVPVMLIGVPAVLAVLLGPICLALRTRPDRRLLTSTLVAIFVLFAVLLLSIGWSDAGPVSVTQAMWILLMLASLLVLSASVQIAPVASVEMFMAMSALGGTVFALGGILGDGGGGRLAAFGGGPNVFARITGIGVIAAIFWMLKGGRWWPLAIMLAPLMVVATVLSGSRGGMLGTMIGLIVISFGLSARQWRRLGLGLLLATPALIFIYRVYGRSFEAVVDQRIVRLTFEEGYTAGRGELWFAAFEVYDKSPVFGTGLGTFIEQNGLYAHNLFLQVLVDAGLLGLLALILVLVFIARRLWTRQIRNPLALGPLACGVTILVASMFSGDYYDTRFFWAYMILAVGAVKQLSDAGEEKLVFPRDVTAWRL